MNIHELKFLADFQPISLGNGFIGQCLTSVLNWGSLFGVCYVIGWGLKLGFN